MTLRLSPEQAAALRKIVEWWKTSEPFSVFQLFGYAGTGKTTLLSKVIEELDISPIFGTYTGKAAAVLTARGMPARTLHSLLYVPRPPVPAEVREARKAYEQNPNEENRARLQKALSFKWELNEASPLAHAPLLIIDECSMVSEEMGKDIARFPARVLAVGDPGQLPPVNGKSYYSSPDVELTEVHRQALDSPIIEASVRVRRGIPLRHYAQPGLLCLPRREMKKSDLEWADQIIVGKNVTRRECNMALATLPPAPGHKLVCLRNNPRHGLMNGQFATVIESVEQAGYYEMLLDVESRRISTRVAKLHFDRYERPDAQMDWFELQRYDEFDFGYAITVHKAQGSQWDKVVFIDDGMLRWDSAARAKWLYTGITRAAEELRFFTR